MKLLIVTESYWPNNDGGALFERRLVQGLIARHGVTIKVWAPSTEGPGTQQHDQNYTIVREPSVTLPGNRIYRVSYWPFGRGRRLLKRFRPDVIHVHNPALLGLTGLRLAKRHGIPVVATNHLMPENLFLGLHIKQAWLQRLIAAGFWRYLIWFHNRCQVVTSPTPTAIELMRQHGLRAKSLPVSNGIDTAVFRPDIDSSGVLKKYGLPHDRPILLYLGRVNGEKRIDLIISALPLILKQHPCHLLLVGDGNSRQDLEKQASELGLNDNVTFTGMIDEADKPAIYNAANIFVIASPAELQSIVTLEAMASQLPVVAVDIAALGELCRDGETGWLFPADDYRALADRVVRLLKSPEQAEKFGQSGRQLVEQKHSSDVMVDHYFQIYQEVLGSKL